MKDPIDYSSIVPINPALALTIDWEGAMDNDSFKMFGITPQRAIELTDKMKQVRIQLDIPDKEDSAKFLVHHCEIISRVTANINELAMLMLKVGSFMQLSGAGFDDEGSGLNILETILSIARKEGRI